MGQVVKSCGIGNKKKEMDSLDLEDIHKIDKDIKKKKRMSSMHSND